MVSLSLFLPLPPTPLISVLQMRGILLCLLTIAEGANLTLLFRIPLVIKILSFSEKKKKQLYLFSVQLGKLTSVSAEKPHQYKIQTKLIHLFLRNYDRLMVDWRKCFLDCGLKDHGFTVQYGIRNLHDYCCWCLLWNQVVFLATRMKRPWKMLRSVVARVGPRVFWLRAHIFFNHGLLLACSRVIVGVHLVTEQE